MEGEEEQGAGEQGADGLAEALPEDPRELLKALLWRQDPGALRLAARDLRIRRAAARRVGEVSEYELQRGADELRRRHGLLTAERTLSWLRHHGLRIEDLEERIEFQIQQRKLRDLVADPEVNAWFTAHQQEYRSLELTFVALREPAAAEALRARLEEEGLTFSEAVAAQIGSVAEACLQPRRYELRHLEPALAEALERAEAKELVGPFRLRGLSFLLHVEQALEPRLDRRAREEIKDLLFERWLDEEERAAASPGEPSSD
jgi:hypothetical protein